MIRPEHTYVALKFLSSTEDSYRLAAAAAMGRVKAGTLVAMADASF